MKIRDIEKEIMDELIDGCGEQLECYHPNFWSNALVPVLVKMVAKERDLKEYYKNLAEFMK